MKNWEKAEKNSISLLGGKPHSDSGKHWWNPNDGSSQNFSFEVKSSEREVIITDTIIRKARKEAYNVGKDWAVVIVIKGEDPVVVVAKTTWEMYEAPKPEFIIHKPFRRIALRSLDIPVNPSWVMFFNRLGAVVIPASTFNKVFHENDI